MGRYWSTLFVSGLLLAGSGYLSGQNVHADDLIDQPIIETKINIVDHSKLLAEGFRGIIEDDYDDQPSVKLDEAEKNAELMNDDSQVNSEDLQPAEHAAIEQIDRVVTGVASRQQMHMKFDSSGRPLKHHQDYPRPTLKSMAASLFDSIDLNPYPGTD